MKLTSENIVGAEWVLAQLRLFDLMLAPGESLDIAGFIDEQRKLMSEVARPEPRPRPTLTVAADRDARSVVGEA